MKKNICRFIPLREIPDVIHTLNFVTETELQRRENLKIGTEYRVHYVLCGSGIIYMGKKRITVHSGDVFFTFPAVPHAIESLEDFKYMYVSYLGFRAGIIMEQLGINPKNFIFQQLSDLEPYWQKCFSCDENVLDYASESALLFAFSLIGSKLAENLPPQKDAGKLIPTLKKYIDDHFTEEDISLKKISGVFSYNRKYISTEFKKAMKIGISDYINTVRVQHACALMEQGFTCVNDIASKCGYNEREYFSRVFKKKMGISPKEHINKI